MPTENQNETQEEINSPAVSTSPAINWRRYIIFDGTPKWVRHRLLKQLKPSRLFYNVKHGKQQVIIKNIIELLERSKRKGSNPHDPLKEFSSDILNLISTGKIILTNNSIINQEYIRIYVAVFNLLTEQLDNSKKVKEQLRKKLKNLQTYMQNVKNDKWDAALLHILVNSTEISSNLFHTIKEIFIEENFVVPLNVMLTTVTLKTNRPPG